MRTLICDTQSCLVTMVHSKLYSQNGTLKPVQLKYWDLYSRNCTVKAVQSK